MKEVNEYAPGTFCWVDLGTTDSNGAKKFYGSLFGWKFEDMPAGPDMVYTMSRLEGRDVAALYQMSKEQVSQGTPPNWLSYVSVRNVDDSIAKAKELGGKVLMGPHDVFEAGRMAILSDPEGAVFAVWQPRQHIGARIVNEPSSFTWNELYTRNEPNAAAFYSALFGWKPEAKQMNGQTYTILHNGDRMNGGIFKITPEMGNIPPHWLVYFAVVDCDETVAKAKETGGNVIFPPTDIPQVGRFSILQDPQGAAFAVIRLVQPQ